MLLFSGAFDVHRRERRALLRQMRLLTLGLRRIMILAFANNHYAGHGPGTVDPFRNLWGVDALPKVQVPRQMGRQSSLFD
jgi:hypothetical protein